MISEHINSQLAEFFNGNEGKIISTSYLLSKMDLHHLIEYKHELGFPLTSIARLYIFRLIKGIRNYEALKKYLAKNELEAFQLGFSKGDDDNLELPPKRTYNHYLKTYLTLDKKHELDLISERILSLATNNNVVLDIEIVKKTIKDKKNRHQTEIRDAVRLVKKFAYPNIDLKIHHNAKFKKGDLLDVLAYISSQKYFASDGAKCFKEDGNKDKEIPSGDLMMHHFSKFKSKTELKMTFNKILDAVFNYCKQNYSALQKRKLEIAYDIHDICYYGKSMNYVCGGEFKDGTSNFFKFLTCSVVIPGRRFIVDVIPIHQVDVLEKLLDESLTRVKSKIKIDKAYLDRGFDRISVINVLNKHKVNFIMPKVRTATVKSAFDKAEGYPSMLFQNFQIGKGQKSVFVNLILADAPSGKNKGVKHAFMCNFPVPPQLSYRAACKFYELYGHRWGIETSYRNLEHDFMPKTTTTNYNIRLFYFLFSVCLYNLWVLVNICISLTLYGKLPTKPVLTAKMFVIILYRAQVVYFDNGG